MDVMGTMRDLDQIRERDDRGETSKLLLIGVGGLAAACVLFAMGVIIGKDHDGARTAQHEDPLARLDALANQMAASSPSTTADPSRLVTSPDSRAAPRSSVGPSPTAEDDDPGLGRTGSAGNESRGRVRTADPAPGVRAAAAPNVAVPDVPVATTLDPTGHVRLSNTGPAALPVAPANRARLSATNTAAPVTPASAGSEGAFTLQVSSFRTAAAAQTLSQRLRERGHRAFVVAAPPQNGVAWHRVRIGPFANLHEAQRYRTEFESRERLPTFVVRRDDAGTHGD